jgi:2-polyprenyl-3-methyl-5-hydroxy-6-metoxy-1,4-benzoquinol methylase
LFTKWDHNIVKCLQCSLSYVNPRNNRVEENSYFEEPYLSSIEDHGVLNPGIEHVYSEIVDNLNTLLMPGRLLDIGCAMGHFMVYARQRSWNVHGIEISKFAADYGYKRWGLPIQVANDVGDASFPDNHFDACVLIEAAQHLPHPGRTFNEIFKLLKPGGIIYLRTPNFASFRSLLQRENWPAVIPMGHLYYFTAETLGKMLTMAGFRRIINLTESADLDQELKAVDAMDGGRSATVNVEELRRRTAIEDQAKLSNARGESLVMCAIKPRSANDIITASLRSLKPLPELENRLVCAPGNSAEDQKVYFVHGGRKHWIISVDWLHRHGYSLNQTVQVDREILQTILLGPPLQ